MSKITKPADISEIIKLLPHGYPMLLVDRVLEYDDKELKAVKNVTFNEAFFQGHFPGKPIMPGVLILEALGQACGLLLFQNPSLRHLRDYLFFMVGVDQAKFKRVVTPGDQLLLNVGVKRIKNNYFSFETRATVDDETAAQAVINLMVNKQNDAKGKPVQ